MSTYAPKNRGNPYYQRNQSKKRRYNMKKSKQFNAAGYNPRLPPGRFRRVGYYGRYNKGLGGELKFIDFALTSADPITTDGGIVPTVCAIPQGVSESERLGRKAHIKSIEIRGRMKVDDTVANDSSATIIRMIVYCDKQANGATATVLDILETEEFTAFRALQNSGRFRILKDTVYTMLPKIGALTGADAKTVFSHEKNIIWKKRLNLPILYSSTTGALTEICCNNIGLLFIVNSLSAAPEFTGRVRLRFQG